MNINELIKLSAGWTSRALSALAKPGVDLNLKLNDRLIRRWVGHNVNPSLRGTEIAATPKHNIIAAKEKWTMPSKFRLSSNIQPVGYSQSAYAATPKAVSTTV